MPAICAMPTFSTSGVTSHGLDLLAAAASADGSLASIPVRSRASPLLQGSTHNSAAALLVRVFKWILDLEFVEMAELTIDDDLPQTPGHPVPARPAITSISQWVERFSLMAVVLAIRFPDKSPEFFLYQATIVGAERNCEGNLWVVYDRQFLREALARKNLNWSVTDPRLYNEAFTGRARCIARCCRTTIMHQLAHATQTGHSWAGSQTHPPGQQPCVWAQAAFP